MGLVFDDQVHRPVFSDEGKFFVDLKNAEGQVGEGDPPSGLKPDVTIKMNSEVFLKIFNREWKNSKWKNFAPKFFEQG